MHLEGLFFPSRVANIIREHSLEALKASKEIPRYHLDASGIWGVNFANCGLQQKDWDEFISGNSHVLDKLRVLHLGNNPDMGNSNVLPVIEFSSSHFSFLDVSHNKELVSLQFGADSPELETLLVSGCSKLGALHFSGNFPKLAAIEAAECAFTEFSVENLSELKFLQLSGNKIEALHISPTCEKLSSIFARANGLTKVAFEGSLPALSILDLAKNSLQFLPLGLNDSLNLDEANFSENHIKDLLQFKPFIERGVQLCWEAGNGGIILQGNHFESAVVGMLNMPDPEEKKTRLLETIRLLEREESPEVRKAKLVLLGNTGSGKTSLADIISNGKKARDGSTYGINLFHYIIDDQVPIEVQGFDFGGQDYFHGTHFAFFGYNVIYLLIWGNGQPNALSLNDQKERRFPLNYWLGSVKFFDKNQKKPGFESTPNPLPNATGAGLISSKQSPIDGVTNNIQLNLLQNLLNHGGAIEELDNKSLKEEYPFVKGINSFNLYRNADADTLKNSDVSAWLNDMIKDYVRPIIISKVEQDVAASLRQCGKVILSLTDVEKLNSRLAHNSEEQTRILSQNLHDRFDCFYHSPKIFASLSVQSDDVSGLTQLQRELLSNYIIANLEKFTNWIYVILAPELKGSGYFTATEVSSRLSKQIGSDDADEVKMIEEFVLAFMLHHQIIFRVNQTSQSVFLAPQYLNDSLRESELLFLDSFEAPVVKYHFREFFHTNLITQVMLRYYRDLLQEGENGDWKYVMWKNKVILYEGKGAAKKKLLLVDFEEEEILSTKNELVRIASVRLHRFMKNAVSDEFIQDVMTFIEGQIHNYSYEKLIVTPFGDYMPVSLLELPQDLSGINRDLIPYKGRIFRRADFKLFPEAKVEGSLMKKIFISYSQRDSEFMRRFEVHLSPLKQKGMIDIWHDRMITNGILWDQKIQEELESADLIIFLLSPDFLNTPYIINEEVPKAKKLGKPLFSIQLKECGWQMIMSELQMALDPNPALTLKVPLIVSDPGNDAQWQTIVKSLEEKIIGLG